MKVRTDIVRMYKDVHSWVGIVAGLALFIAFYAGAITMFEEPLQRWASPPSRLGAPVSLERAPDLVRAVHAAYPESREDYDVHVATGPAQPARMSWTIHSEDDHGSDRIFYASFAEDGSVAVAEQGPSPVAQFIDVLHQHVGLPFEPEISLIVMGAVSLLYAVAIVSGVIVLLPSLVSDLFALRIGRNVKRMWLDVHNLLGVFSLPFHLVMALTAVVFAFHDQFYDAQGATFARDNGRPAAVAAPPSPETRPLMPPAELLSRLERQAPGFTATSLGYHLTPDGRTRLTVAGHDPRFGHRAPTYGMAQIDPYDGTLLESDYMPGHQDGWSATITSFFALHFGNFGGAGVRWAYFLLGLAGALIFYTGNLLWIESRRKRERKAGAVEQTRATKILAALTVGIPLGCIAGISVTLAAAKPLGLSATPALHSGIYYAVFVAFTLWALMRGAPRAGRELIPAAAASFLLVPLATITTSGVHPPIEWWVDAVCIVLSALLMLTWRAAARRTVEGARDSVWYRGAAAG